MAPGKAPDLAEMEDMAHAMLALLPEDFRKLCAGVIIRVDDFPTDEVLEEMQAETEFDLLGLFQGVGLPFQEPGQYRAVAQHDLAVSPADPGLLGRT